VANTAYVTVTGFTGANPGLNAGTVGLTCSWVIFAPDGSVLEGPVGGWSVMANFSYGDQWADIQAALTAQLQADVGDPDLTVVFIPG
jgi:hypothetical protein